MRDGMLAALQAWSPIGQCIASGLGCASWLAYVVVGSFCSSVTKLLAIWRRHALGGTYLSWVEQTCRSPILSVD